MRVLLLGDSVRMFYEGEVKRLLGDEYEVVSPKENCRFAAYFLNSLRFWLEEFPTPDVIHFNAGLWDTAILYKEDGCFTDINVYSDTMRKIVRVLRNTGARLIFATTTPVHDDKYKLEGPMPPAHKNEEIARYNEAVLNIMKKNGVLVNDLFSLMYPERKKYLKDDMIHPNDEGVKLLGAAVADVIKNCGSVSRQARPCVPQQIIREEKIIQ